MSSALAIGVITYKPGQSLLPRLALVLKGGYPLYIFDNSPEDAALKNFADKNSAGVKYLACGKNAGLGYALAAVGARAYADGCGALLFFDQDTVFTAETLNFIRGFNQQNPGLGKEYSSIVFNARNTPMRQQGGLALNNVLLAVNSGSLYYLANLKRLGWHNKDFFVDCVDYEFCLNTYNHGLKVGEYTRTPGFDHSTEQADKLYNFFGVRRPFRAYPLARIWDSVTATGKLLLMSLKAGNLGFFRAVGTAAAKYLVIQVYVRLADIFE